MIPENKKAAVKKALQTAFGVDGYDDIQQLTKGLSSAMVFKIIVDRKPYLLRVVTRTDALGDPSFYYNCMKVAAEKEVAPHIYYMNTENRISVTDYVNEQPFPLEVAKKMLPALLRRLHSLPKFPFRINYFDSMERFFPRFQAADVLPKNEADDLLKTYHRITAVYPTNDTENWVSCHNDSKPENIVFDGMRPWFVDWESAFLNDRYLDLAIVANFVVRNKKEEADYLESYFGNKVKEYQHARFFLMQQILHVYYFIFLMAFDNGPKSIDITDRNKRNFTEFHDGIWNGSVSLAFSESKREYAMLHLRQFQLKSQSKRFEDALKMVAKRQ